MLFAALDLFSQPLEFLSPLLGDFTGAFIEIIFSDQIAFQFCDAAPELRYVFLSFNNKYSLFALNETLEIVCARLYLRCEFLKNFPTDTDDFIFCCASHCLLLRLYVQAPCARGISRVCFVVGGGFVNALLQTFQCGSRVASVNGIILSFGVLHHTIGTSHPTH
jgi:hypothetical protein